MGLAVMVAPDTVDVGEMVSGWATEGAAVVVGDADSAVVTLGLSVESAGAVESSGFEEVGARSIDGAALPGAVISCNWLRNDVTWVRAIFSSVALTVPSRL